MDQAFEDMQKLGATQMAAEMYPRVCVRYGYLGRRGVFAYRYFNDDDLELGYYIPGISTEMHIFRKPRVWAPEHLANLEWRIGKRRD